MKNQFLYFQAFEFTMRPELQKCPLVITQRSELHKNTLHFKDNYPGKSTKLQTHGYWVIAGFKVKKIIFNIINE